MSTFSFLLFLIKSIGWFLVILKHLNIEPNIQNSLAEITDPLVKVVVHCFLHFLTQAR